MYSAGVNAALAEFFSIADTEAGNIPPKNGNILSDASNTLNNLRNIPASNIPAGDNIPSDIGNILARRDNIPARSNSNIPLDLVTYHLKAL